MPLMSRRAFEMSSAAPIVPGESAIHASVSQASRLRHRDIVGSTRCGARTRTASINDRPVISFGTGSCISVSSVGATSASVPPARSAASGYRRRPAGPVRRCARCAPGRCGVRHLLDVAVIGGDQALDRSISRTQRRCAPRHSSSVSTALHGGVENARVAHHVGIGEIADDRVVVARTDRLDEPVGDLARAHLRLAGRKSRLWATGSGSGLRRDTALRGRR